MEHESKYYNNNHLQNDIYLLIETFADEITKVTDENLKNQLIINYLKDDKFAFLLDENHKEYIDSRINAYKNKLKSSGLMSILK